MDDESDAVLANVLWISTGIAGCALNTILFVVALLNSSKSFYRTLLLVIALVDWGCAFSGIFQATWFYKIDNVLYSVDYGVSNAFPDWLVQVNIVVWLVTFYAELIVITYTFVWRAVLISNSRQVHLFENNLVFILLSLITCTISYFDWSIDCCVEYENLSLLETLRILLPAMLSGLHFIVIAASAIFIQSKIKTGTFSKTMKSTHKKRLFVLITQAINPLLLNFCVSLFYEVALMAPVPSFLVSLIPFSCVHPILNPLIILTLTSEHRRFIGRGCSQETRIASSSSTVRAPRN